MAESLKDKTAKGLMWGALNSGTTQLLNLFFGIFSVVCSLQPTTVWWVY